jgi:hypothetical protein
MRPRMSNGLNVGSCSCRFEKGSEGSSHSPIGPYPYSHRLSVDRQITIKSLRTRGMVTIHRRRPRGGTNQASRPAGTSPSSSSGSVVSAYTCADTGGHAEYPEQPYRLDSSQRSTLSKELSPLKATGNRGAKLELVSHSVGISKDWTDATVCIELRALGEWLW